MDVYCLDRYGMPTQLHKDNGEVCYCFSPSIVSEEKRKSLSIFDYMENLNKGDLLAQYYLAIYFDLLGQREVLRAIKEIPKDESKKENFIEQIKKSLGNVLTVRDIFNEFFDSAESYIPNTSLVPEKHRQEFIESQKEVIYRYGLSDAFVIAVPLMNGNENCTPMNGIYSALTATCATFLMALSLKIPARAGIDVGVGFNVDEREVYGPALERAVFIEGQLAEYPRLVVGPQLYSYLNGVENQNCQTSFGEIAKEIAKTCKKLLVQDTDGHLILNYLGKNINEIFENNIDRETVVRAWDFVQKQYMKYFDEQNDKLASRYFRIGRYFKSHLNLWDIK